MNAEYAPAGTTIKPVFRAEHVGSFLRPAALLGARAKYQRGDITVEQLRMPQGIQVMRQGRVGNAHMGFNLADIAAFHTFCDEKKEDLQTRRMS